MGSERSFKFADERLQQELLDLVRASAVPHTVDPDGTLGYAFAGDVFVGNELICSIRDKVFPEWHVFTLEGDELHRPRTTARYRAYMRERGVPFVEEVDDGFTWFLIPEGYDSFEWDIPWGEEA